MADSTRLAKAQLLELDPKFKQLINPDKTVTVQFNPETLKVSFSNQINNPAVAGDQNGPQKQQFTGGGATKLSVQLWFDITVPVAGPSASASLSAGPVSAGVSIGPDVKDVRELTQAVAYFITPEPRGENKAFIPPGVRFLWGSFQFDGVMESLEESLEFFSNEGIPLRASVTLSLTQQKILKLPPASNNPFGGAVPGIQPLIQASAGATLQGIADSQGQGANWQAIASANGIENPRLLQPGQLVNTNVNTPGS